MNAEQLNGVLHRMASAYASERVLKKLDALRAQLDAIANNANDAGAQTNYRNALQTLADALALPSLSQFSIREQKIIEELGIDHLTGPELLARISETLNDAARAPRLVHDEIATIHNETSAELQGLRQVADGLEKLGISRGDPEDGATELGLFIPRHGENLTLQHLIDEGTDLNRLVAISYEIVEGKATSPEVSFLTSCDYGYLVLVAPAVIHWLMARIEQALEITKKYVEAREALDRLKTVGVADEDVKPLLEKKKADHENALAEMVTTAVHLQSKSDDPTKNDQAARLTSFLRTFVERHQERGNYIDVRVRIEQLPPDGTIDGVQLESMQVRIAQQQQIAAQAQRIHELEQQSIPRIAQIAGPTDDQDSNALGPKI